MAEPFRLVEEKFSEIDNEWWWTYSIRFEFIFNRKRINKITITGHLWKKKGREWMTKELVLRIFTESLSNKSREPNKKYKNRDVFIEERALASFLIWKQQFRLIMSKKLLSS